MQVVQADLSHLEMLAPLFDAYRQFYNQALDLEAAREFLRARLERQESVIFLALQDNQGLGFTQLYPSFSSVSLKRLWILNDLFVAPEARRLGVAGFDGAGTGLGYPDRSQRVDAGNRRR